VIGDGSALVLLSVNQLTIDCNSNVYGNPNEVAVIVDTKRPNGFPNNSFWRCPLGHPWHWLTNNRGTCLTCPVLTYDVALASSSSTSSHEPECSICAPPMRCSGNGVRMPMGWQSLVSQQVQMINSTGTTSRPLFVAALPPAGYGCSHEECEWSSSCAMGRDATVPFCGRCLDGYR
jgi:hypothetical protein